MPPPLREAPGPSPGAASLSEDGEAGAWRPWPLRQPPLRGGSSGSFGFATPLLSQQSGGWLSSLPEATEDMAALLSSAPRVEPTEDIAALLAGARSIAGAKVPPRLSYREEYQRPIVDALVEPTEDLAALLAQASGKWKPTMPTVSDNGADNYLQSLHAKNRVVQQAICKGMEERREVDAMEAAAQLMSHQSRQPKGPRTLDATASLTPPGTKWETPEADRRRREGNLSSRRPSELRRRLLLDDDDEEGVARRAAAAAAAARGFGLAPAGAGRLGGGYTIGLQAVQEAVCSVWRIVQASAAPAWNDLLASWRSVEWPPAACRAPLEECGEALKPLLDAAQTPNVVCAVFILMLFIAVCIEMAWRFGPPPEDFV